MLWSRSVAGPLRPKPLRYTAQPMRLSPVWLVGCVSIALVAVLIAASAGWLGPLVTCGADGAAVCMRWPGLVAGATWAAFTGLIAALAVVQARDWRHVSVARREVALLGVVLAAALVERAWRIDLAEVGYDEASAASLVAAWRLQGVFPLTGIVSSVGVPNPPGWPYLLATVLLWYDSPYAVVALGIAVGLIAIVLIWWVGRRWIGPWGALAAAAFYASGFWAAFLGRGGWQPVFLQLPVILCADALLVLAIRRWPWALVVACGWLGLMVQLHYVALVFAAMLPVAAWPARRALRPIHLVLALLTVTALMTPFLIYELNPSTRFRDLASLAADAGGTGGHWDLEAWNLLWTLVSNGGAAGLGGPESDSLRQALGRWASLGMIGVPLVASGLVAAVAGWPRGWRGFMIAAWALTPAIGLAHHTLGLLFHYLYIGLPGMAWAVGALAEWSVFRGGVVPRFVVSAGLAVYAVVSAATLWVVLDHVDRTATYPGSSRPLGVNEAAATTALSVRPAGGQVLIGGPVWEVQILRFALGYSEPSQVFDDCGQVPLATPSVYLLNSERSRAAVSLAASGAPLLARVALPDDAFVIYGEPHGTLPDSTSVACSQ
jgi:hypothetical protein